MSSKKDAVRCTATDTARRISEMRIVIDKLHFKGHKDPWCAQHCDPYSFEDLDEVMYDKYVSFQF